MWIDGGKRFRFYVGRDFYMGARYAIDLYFGYREQAKEFETVWKHHWCFSTRALERRLKVWQWKWRNRKTRHGENL